jgi:hypothetical protein
MNLVPAFCFRFLGRIRLARLVTRLHPVEENLAVNIPSCKLFFSFFRFFSILKDENFITLIIKDFLDQIFSRLGVRLLIELNLTHNCAGPILRGPRIGWRGIAPWSLPRRAVMRCGSVGNPALRSRFFSAIEALDDARF